MDGFSCWKGYIIWDSRREAQMTRIIVRKLNGKVGARHARTSVVSKSVHKPSGERARILSVDANSPTFGSDLSIIFERNVAKARRANKKKFGSPDRVAQKAR
jgi:hypothetical protein